MSKVLLALTAKSYSYFQGISYESVDEEVNKTLKDIDLSDKANCIAKHLSGGQKRKLSVGIAIIGDPKVRMKLKFTGVIIL